MLYQTLKETVFFIYIFIFFFFFFFFKRKGPVNYKCASYGYLDSMLLVHE